MLDQVPRVLGVDGLDLSNHSAGSDALLSSVSMASQLDLMMV